ncbi:hypothetical protein FGIG_11776 [Fasciola gigantica]|uniref:Uncharacterized protein n=1 Tax=Fasciola gigantica TaxID=46835 RepID=A0A504YQ81_FASGI|nr:hypothetical protein FGIG_11776 [Fasciola gigantica]
MSANSMLTNNGMSQPVLSPQQQVSNHRTRAVSSCSTSGIPVAQYQQNYSQSYQTFPPIHASWAQPQQGMYMNVYPGTSISEVDDLNLNQSGEVIWPDFVSSTLDIPNFFVSLLLMQH